MGVLEREGNTKTKNEKRGKHTMKTTVNTRTDALTLNAKAENKRDARIEKLADKFVSKTLKNITESAKSGMQVAWSPKIKKGTPVSTVQAKLEARGFKVEKGNTYFTITWSDRA
jgi:hypothetical protein